MAAPDAPRRRRRLPLALAGATVAAVTAGLLARLAIDHRTASRPPTAPSPIAAASPTGPLPDISPAWRVAFEDARGGVSVMHADGSGARRVLDDAAQPAWSPDRRLAFVRRGNVWVANADGSAGAQVTAWPETDEDVIKGVAWAPKEGLTIARRETLRLSGPDGRAMAFPAVTLYHVGARSGARPEVLLSARDGGAGAFFSSYAAPAWSPSGDRLAYAVNGDVWVATRVEGEGRQDDPLRAAWDRTRVAAAAGYDAPNWRGSRMNLHVTALSWSPDGKSLAYGVERIGGSGIAEVHVLRLDTDADHRTRAVSDMKLPVYGYRPSFSPDGNWVLFRGNPEEEDPTGDTFALWAATPDGRTLRRLTAEGAAPGAAVW